MILGGRVLRRPGVGGTAAPHYRLVTEWGDLQDPDARCSVGSGHDGNGELTFEMVGDVTSYFGHQTNAPRCEVRIRDIPGFETWDPLVDDIEAYDEFLEMPAGTPQYGAAVGVVDAAFADRATSNGIGCLLRPANATQHQTINVGPAGASGSASTSFSAPVIGCSYRFAGLIQATDHRIQTQTRHHNGAWLLGPSANSLPMTQDPDTYYLYAGVYHSDTESGTPTIRRRVWARLVPKVGAHPVPVPDPKPTPAEGVFEAILYGDSTGNGWGTEDGGDALPAGLSIWEAGVAASVYPGPGTGVPPAPGYLRGIADAALAAGYTDVRLHRWATNGQRMLSMMISGDFRDGVAEFDGAPDDVDALFLAIGSNNASDAQEALGYTTEFEQRINDDHDALQSAFPNARLVHWHPIATTGYAGADRVRAAITASVARRPSTRAWVPGEGDEGVDQVHPSLTTYYNRGVDAFAAWAALP